jgi:uncharacterized protein YijF (DUF1287 family)
MVKTNILVLCSLLYSTKKFLKNLVETHFKLGNEMTATQVLYVFNISYDAHFRDLTLSGTCISHTSVVCTAVILGLLMVPN